MISKVYVSEDGVNFSKPFIYNFDVTKFIEEHKNTEAEYVVIYDISNDIKNNTVEFSKAPKKIGIALATTQAFLKLTKLPIDNKEAMALAENSARRYYGMDKGNTLSGFKYPSSTKVSTYNSEMESIGEFSLDDDIKVDTIRQHIRLLASENKKAKEKACMFLYTIMKYGISRNRTGEFQYGIGIAEEILIKGKYIVCNKLDEAICDTLESSYSRDKANTLIKTFKEAEF